MVDLTFRARAAHFVPLALLRRLAALPSSTPPPELKYLGAAGVAAVKGAPPSRPCGHGGRLS